MSKLIVLELDGDLPKQGFGVTLEIKEEGNINPICRRRGKLPPAQELSDRLQSHWQEIYCNLAAPYRIKNKQIISKSSWQLRVAQCNQSRQDLSQKFNYWLKSEEFRVIDRSLREQLKLDEEIRFLIRTDNQELQKLPWEEWEFFQSYRHAEMGWTFPNYELSQSVKTNNLQVRILVILGHRQGIDIDTDKKILESLPNVELFFLDEPQREQINHKLWESDWDIIFFAGHSETKLETGRIYINPHDSITVDELCYGLRKAVERGLKLAIFNSCDGLGLARSLFNLNIPQMIVMRELVPDQVAHEFLKYFLSNFAQGQSLYIAVREAREKLQGLEDKFPCATWLPVIFQNPTVIPPKWNDLTARVRQTRQLSQINFLPLLLTSFVFTGLVIGVRSLGILQPLEKLAYDQLVRMRTEDKPDPRVTIAKITEEDIQEFQALFIGDRISDKLLLKALKNINQHQPIAIGLDILRDIPMEPGHQELNNYLKNTPQIVSICFVGESEIKDYDDYGYAPPPGSLANNISFSNVIVDADGVIRRHLISTIPPLSSKKCEAKYSLSLELGSRFLEKTQKIKLEVVETSLGSVLKLGKGVFYPLKNQGGFYQKTEKNLDGQQILLNYRSQENIAEEITLKQIINNDFDPDLIKNKIVIIGYTAKSKGDLHFTPYGNHPNQKMAGVKIHAQMTSQLISIALNERPLLQFLPWWGDAMVILIVAFVGGIPILYWRSSPFPLIIMITEIAIIFSFCIYHITAPLIPIILGLITITVLITYFPRPIAFNFTIPTRRT